MRYRNRYSEPAEELNVWPSFTDLMSNAFMIITLFLLLLLVKPYLAAGVSKAPTPTEAPPIIVIQDTESYRFSSGSAELPTALNIALRDRIAQDIETYAKRYDIDVVEVIGHTDGQPNGALMSNLDQRLEATALGQQPIAKLRPGSNVDLGLMRALAVVQALQNLQKYKQRLPGLKFRVYSAAQLILPTTGKFAPVNRVPAPERRRIEIRFTRLGQEKAVR